VESEGKYVLKTPSSSSVEMLCATTTPLWWQIMEESLEVIIELFCWM